MDPTSLARWSLEDALRVARLLYSQSRPEVSHPHDRPVALRDHRRLAVRIRAGTAILNPHHPATASSIEYLDGLVRMSIRDVCRSSPIGR